MERHGEEPVIKRLKNKAEEMQFLKKRISGFHQKGHHSLGIICKTQKQAARIHAELTDDFPETVLLTDESAAFSGGVIVCSVHMAKGLEFDEVVVPGADAQNYSEPIDRNLLYIACTRAMHELTLSFMKEQTPLLENSKIQPDRPTDHSMEFLQ